MKSTLCHVCGELIAGHDSVHYGSMEGSYRDLCSRCFNEDVARAGGVEIQHIHFDPVEMTDVAGRSHRFHFRLHLLGDRVSLEAFELRDGSPSGYQFQIIGEAEGDLFVLLAELIARIRRALALLYLKDRESFGLGIADFLVRGRITWGSAEDGRVPLLVIDGRDVPWEQFGRMLMTFEGRGGRQFKLQIRGRSEEV